MDIFEVGRLTNYRFQCIQHLDSLTNYYQSSTIEYKISQAGKLDFQKIQALQDLIKNLDKLLILTTLIANQN